MRKRTTVHVLVCEDEKHRTFQVEITIADIPSLEDAIRIANLARETFTSSDEKIIAFKRE